MTNESKPRRGSRWLWLGGVGLAVLVALAALPLWAAGPAAGQVEKRFSAACAGRLEVGALELSWTARQAAREVRLFDPEGALVAEMSLDLPSLLDLARGRGKRLGEVHVTARADLISDDTGVSNLERALAPREPSERGGGAGGDSGGQGAGVAFDLVLDLSCPRLTWSDARTRALGKPFELEALTGRVVLQPGRAEPGWPVEVTLDGAMPGAMSGAGEGALHVRAELRGILDGGQPEGQVEARIEGFPSGLVDALAGLDGLLSSGLGETFDLLATADGELSAGRVSIELEGPAGSLGFLGQLSAGALRASGPDQGLDLRCGAPGEVLARYLQPALPAGGALTAHGLVLSLREFDLPIPAGELDPAAWLQQISASFGLTLERASVTLPSLPGGPLDAADVLLSAQVEPERPCVLSLFANLPASAGGIPPGTFDLEVNVVGLAALLPGAAPAIVEEGWTAYFSGQAKGLETARVDALLGQQGLLVDTLGATSEVSFGGVWPPTEEPLRLTLDAPGATLAFIGVIQDGVLVASGDQSIEARLPLSPLFSERIVGPLVPLMVELQKPTGAAPLGLSVTDFRLPLDGDLSGLEATVRLELGQVVFELVPGLSELLARFGQQNARQTTSLAPFALRIEQGVARYDGLPLEIQGHAVSFRGAFDLAKREFDFDADVPLAVFGDGVVKELDKVRKYLDPELAVPVEISGSWRKPKIGVGKSFLDTTVKQAAEGALKKGLFDLLDKELGKDR